VPALENSRHEAFCQARAKGFSREDAYEEAGFSPGNCHAHRLMARPEVCERIDELRGEQADISAAGTRAVLAALVKMAQALGEQVTPQSAKAAHDLLMEARRLRDVLAGERKQDRRAEIRFSVNDMGVQPEGGARQSTPA
jgi:hypothetical protein